MADVLIYENNYCTLLKSVNTGDYLTQVPSDKDNASLFAKPGVIINPDLSAVEGVPQRYWKLANGEVVEMTQAEKDIVDTPPPPSDE